jgi:hypothetical protein
MENKGLLISVWEYDLINDQEFWRRVQDSINKNQIGMLGFSTLSPYGLTYSSENLDYVYYRDFTKLILEKVSKIETASTVEIYLWGSILYNNFLPDHYRSISASGEKSTEYICPNRVATRHLMKTIIQDMVGQEWLASLKSRGFKVSFLLDGVVFNGIDHCFCDECSNRFMKEFQVEATRFQKFKENLLKYVLTEPLIYKNWVDFRRKTLSELMTEIISSLKPQLNASVSYSGFSDETHQVSSQIRSGAFIEDFIDSDAKEIVIEGADRWLSDSDVFADIILHVPFWRDMIRSSGKGIGFMFRGALSSPAMKALKRLAEQAGIERVFLAPMSSHGVHEFFKSIGH